MGFHYAREKKKFDAEWAKTAAWYKAEGMPDEDIEAMRRFDWSEWRDLNSSMDEIGNNTPYFFALIHALLRENKC